MRDQCVISSFYNDRECDTFCAQLDPDCSDQCVINSYYDDDRCDRDCALTDLECCLADADCSDLEVCVEPFPESEPACALANGRAYTLSVSSVVLSTTDQDGEAWDPFGGAPDPYIAVRINGTQTIFSATLSDTFSGPNLVRDVVLNSFDLVDIFIYDEDSSDDDFGGGFCIGGCGQPIGYEKFRNYAEFFSDSDDRGVESMLVSISATPG